MSVAVEIEDELEDLSSAEDFLEYFEIEFDAKVVQVNRLHIMQRFHDYLEKGNATLAEAESTDAVRSIYRSLLLKAYEDFVNSDALTEKVFKVFKRDEPQTTFVSIDELLGP